MSKQPEALRVADWLEHHAPMLTLERPMEAAADVRRLHSLNAELVDALKLLDEAFCADDYGTREGRNKGRRALVAARAAIAKAEAQQ